jgi:hypothetical protein
MSSVRFWNAHLDSSLAAEYASEDDILNLFSSDMSDLFHLAILLTADAEKAEDCIIISLHECLSHESILKCWLPVWIRTSVTRNGISMVTGAPGLSPATMPERSPRRAIHQLGPSAQDASEGSAAILALNDFDRLVYVLCVLEHYRLRDCALLLKRSRQDVRDAQCRAMEQVAAFEHEIRRAPHRPSAVPGLRSGDESSSRGGACGGLLN